MAIEFPGAVLSAPRPSEAYANQLRSHTLAEEYYLSRTVVSDAVGQVLFTLVKSIIEADRYWQLHQTLPDSYQPELRAIIDANTSTRILLVDGFAADRRRRVSLYRAAYEQFDQIKRRPWQYLKRFED